MTLVKDELQNVPVKFNGYDCIEKSNLDILVDKKAFIKHFKDIPKGSLDEILLSYDNYKNRFMLRVNGRGNDLCLSMEYLETLYDHVGPYSANFLDVKKIPIEEMEMVIAKFFIWMEEHISQ